MRPKILITRAVFPEVVGKLAQHFDVEDNQDDYVYTSVELAEKLQGKDGVFATIGERFSADLLAACRGLKVISNMAVGYNNIDIPAANHAGIMVTNTPDVLNQATADFAWALLMATARRITESERWLRAGKWDTWRYDSFLGADVHGATLGILGMGRIGQAIARRSMGFNMKVIYHNRSRLPAEKEAYANHAGYVSREELLKQADHLVLVLPYSVETHHSIRRNELDLMKPTATLINIARGGIVDDVALIEALRERRIAAAGLDVFENEPSFNKRFLELPNVVLTPHIGSATESSRCGMANRAADNLIAALSGKLPPDLVNPQVFTGQ
jgi:gluconate 2-dehydrogenase